MKKSLCILLTLVLLICSISISLSEENTATQIDLDSMTIDELLLLQKQITEKLSEKGHVVYTELEHGSKGDEVLDLQTRLRDLGYYSGSLNGKFDSETQKAFKLFEKSNGLVNDGKASQSDLVVLFSSSAIAKAETIKETAKETAEPKATSTPQISGDYLPFSEFDYTLVSRYPTEYYGQKIILKGTVVQVMGSRAKGYDLRLATSGSYEDIVYITINFDPGYNILKDDKLTVYATMSGTHTYTSTWLQTITIPSAHADIIELR